MNIRVRRPRVAELLTQRHRQTHVAWATTRLHWFLILLNEEIHLKKTLDTTFLYLVILVIHVLN
jgi:hypothetical protein